MSAADDLFIKRAFAAAAGRRSARFAASSRRGSGMITVVSGLEEKGLLQDGRGRFIGAGIQTDLAAANRRLARELAELTAETMQKGLKRPAVSSRRLYEALLDPNNYYSDQFGFGVGDPEWLDRSQAKYWRQIDQGYTGHLGREITGVFGATLTGAYGGFSEYGPYPIAGPAFTAISQGTGGRLRPMGRKYALRLLRAQAGAGAGGPGRRGGLGNRGARNRFSAPTRGVIAKPITPERYFKKAWEEFNIKGRYMATVRDVISKSFGGQGIPTAANIRFMSGQAGAVQPPPSRRFR